MSKCVVIKGCKDCPYAYCDSKAWNIWTCTHGHFSLNMNDEELPETPHPDCKLNDLPTEDEIKRTANCVTEDRYSENFYEKGANYVLNQITK